MEGVLEVNPEQIDTLHTDGMTLPYVEFSQVEPALKLVHGGEDYWYVRTLPLKGYGAVMARHIRELEAEGKKPVLARFWSRIYIYATGVTPIGTGRK
jgi:hypothetical protein